MKGGRLQEVQIAGEMVITRGGRNRRLGHNCFRVTAEYFSKNYLLISSTSKVMTTYCMFSGQKSSMGRMIATAHARPEVQTMIRTSVTRLSYTKGCLIAIKRSAVNKTEMLSEMLAFLIVVNVLQNMPLSPLIIKPW